MSYPTPTFDQMRSFLRSFFTFLFPDRNVSPLSLFGRLVTWVAGAATDLHAHVDASERAAMPDSAEGAEADRHARLWGTERKGATPARRPSALRVTGTGGTPITAGEQLTDPNTGLTYETASGGVVDAGTLYIDVDLVAVDTGSKTRLPAHTVLEFVTPPAGINTQAEVQIDVNLDGQDQELTGALRLRYLALIADRPAGGSPPDFVSWSLELDGIAEAYCYPNRAGRGSVDVAALHANRALLTAPERAELLEHLRDRAPGHLAGTGGDLRVLEPQPQSTLIELLITPDGAAAHAFDWNDSTPPEVLLWDAPSMKITLTAPRPASMAVGHRLIVKDVAGDGSGAEVVIEALPSGTPEEIIVATLPTGADGAPLTVFAGDLIYSGGPLVAPIRDAIVAHMNGEILYAAAGRALPASVAESAGSTARLEVLAMPIGTANPGQAYGPWSGAIRRALLAGIATYTRGVANVDVALPVADYEATDYPFPSDELIGVIVPSRVIVRGA